MRRLCLFAAVLSLAGCNKAEECLGSAYCDYGTYCNDDRACVPGCSIDDDCPGEQCNVASHQCIPKTPIDPTLCSKDDDCANGSYCGGDQHCAAGCRGDLECGSGGRCDAHACICTELLASCSGSCADLKISQDHCGSCDAACGTSDACISGACLPVCTGTVDVALGETMPFTAHPSAMLAIDLDGNGSRDLLVLDSEADQLIAMRWSGSGFVETARVSIPNLQSELVAGKLNGDDFADVIVATPYDSTAAIFFGTSSGGLTAGGPIAVGAWGRGLALGDVDGDGDLDLAVANSDGLEVSVLRNNGNGTFAQRQTIAYGDSPYHVALADLTGDGKAELVVVDSFHQLSVHTSNGDGTFSAPRIYDNDADYILVSDLDHDGDSDLLLAGPEAISMINNNGALSAHVGGDMRGYDRAQPALADLDGDGFDELVSAAYADFDGDPDYRVQVLHGNSDGTFDAGKTYVAGAKPTALAAADFDGDQHADVALGLWGASSATVIRTWSSGQVHLPTVTGFDNFGIGIFAGDVDGDRRADLVTEYTGELDVNGARVATFFGSFNFSLLADVDGDHRADLATAYDGNLELRTAADNFANTRMWPAPGHAAWIGAGDADRDGDVDLYVADQSSFLFTVFKNAGDGTFDESQPVDMIFPLGFNWLRVADVNGDGFADIAGGLSDDSLVVGLNDQNGGYVISRVIDVRASLTTFADLDANSRLALIVGNEFRGQFEIYRNIADGNLDNPETSALLDRDTVAVFARDLNHDRKDEVIIVRPNGVEMLNHGSRTSAWTISGALLADFDGDGFDDLFTVDDNLRTWIIEPMICR